MNNRPTPETDAARHDLSDYGSPVPCSWGDWIHADVASKLERERDEAIADRDIARLIAMDSDRAHDRMVGELEKVYKERDEARNLACVYQHQYYMHVHPNAVVPYFSWEKGQNK